VSEPGVVRVHLVDGTYELFRQFFGRPPEADTEGMDVAAVRGVLSSLVALLEGGATHVGVATDHVIESFRNELWPGYKTSEGIDRRLLSQFGLLEEAMSAVGFHVWPMVELEADDALASGAAVCADDPAVRQVRICTPDKDLAQCVREERVVQLDRRRVQAEASGPGGSGGDPEGVVTDEAGVWERFGVAPCSIPDYLALVGDAADGFPGLKGWGKRSASTVLARYGHLEAIPALGERWDVTVRGGRGLAATLAGQMEDAKLFRDLATLRVDRSLLGDVGALRWGGPTRDAPAMLVRLRAKSIDARVEAVALSRA
jgi:5'-3' exonuclease